MMAEVFDSVEKTMEYYGGDKHPLSDFPFNFYLTTNIGIESSAHDIRNTIEQWMSNLPDSKWANWVVSFCISKFRNGWSLKGSGVLTCIVSIRDDWAGRRLLQMLFQITSYTMWITNDEQIQIWKLKVETFCPGLCWRNWTATRNLKTASSPVQILKYSIAWHLAHKEYV